MTMPPDEAGRGRAARTSDGEHWRHLESLLADLYRREIDTEENIWRSLPFFSATLALEVTALAQTAPEIPALGAGLAWLPAVIGVVVVVLVGAVLLCLHRSIGGADFAYIAGELDLVAYVAGLERHARGLGQGADPPEALLRRSLVEQYAAAVVHNRAINQRRVQARTRAGNLLLLSIVATLALIVATAAPRLAAGPAVVPASVATVPGTVPGTR